MPFMYQKFKKKVINQKKKKIPFCLFIAFLLQNIDLHVAFHHPSYREKLEISLPLILSLPLQISQIQSQLFISSFSTTMSGVWELFPCQLNVFTVCCCNPNAKPIHDLWMRRCHNGNKNPFALTRQKEIRKVIPSTVCPRMQRFFFFFFHF